MRIMPLKSDARRRVALGEDGVEVIVVGGGNGSP
jgi:hypothetical protein